MSLNQFVTFYHAPNTRSTGVHILLEELQADYEIKPLNMKTGEHRAADYLAINPMGKVPAIVHDGALITEQVAVYLYLGDLYENQGLAPQMGDPLRGPYLRWMAFYGSCYEPAVIDIAQKREPAPRGMNPYGDFDTMMNTLTGQLSVNDYMLGANFTALDVLWGTALQWTAHFGLVTATPVIQSYIDRVNQRPAAVRARQKDEEIASGFSE